MWQKLELEDIPKISPFLNLLSSHLSDFTIGGMFMWKDYFNIKYFQQVFQHMEHIQAKDIMQYQHYLKF